MRDLEKEICGIFMLVQANKTCHRKYEKKMRTIFENADFEKFCEAFLHCLVIPLSKGEKNPKIENALVFAAKFAVSLQPPQEDNDQQEPMEPFLRCLFDFLLEHHSAKDQGVRYRICCFLNMLLTCMGETAFLDDQQCDKITETMTERLLDKSPRVRAQAVLALHRLQDPTDENCKVIKMYIFHLTKDPNGEVRKAVLSSIAVNKITLQAVYKRTRDVNEYVRKMAYEFMSKVTVRSLSISQREELLNTGLNDESTAVQRSVKNILLPAWLTNLDGKYKSLLRALDAELAVDTAILAMKALFENADPTELIKQLPVDPETKLIPMDRQSSEMILYWRCLVEHFHRESRTDELDQCLPELSKFCDYINFFMTIMASEDDGTGDRGEHEFILYQMFEIAKTYDLGDEIGRRRLSETILHALTIEPCTEKLIDSIVKYLEIVVPDVNLRLESLAHTINEIRMTTHQTEVAAPISEEEERKKKLEIAKRKVQLNEIQEEEYEAIQSRDFLKAQTLKEQIEKMKKEIEELAIPTVPMVLETATEEKNDRDTMVNCLAIVYNMSCVKSVTALTPTLRSLFDYVIGPNLDHEEKAVFVLALKALGVFCLLDEAMAKEYIMLFFLQFSLEDESVDIWAMALKAIFDLLLCYGFEAFDFEPHDDRPEDRTEDRTQNRTEETNDTDVENPRSNLIKIIIGLLDNREQELRTIATEGLCTLLLHERITGIHLLSRLIILLHNPISEDDVYMRKCLCSFFGKYVKKVPEGQEMLAQAFLPTLRILANAPKSSPLYSIKPHHVAEFLTSLTSSRNHKPGSECYDVHNNLALSILAEALDPDTDIDQATLLKSLTYLQIKFEDNLLMDNAREAADRIIASMDESEMRLIKYVQEFKTKFIVNAEEETQENAEIAETADANENLG